MELDDIALTLVPGLGIKGIAHLLEIFGSAEKIFDASEESLILDARLRPDIARNISSRKGHSAAERELRYCRRHGIQPVASTDPRYPELLREIPDFPHVLYVMGNIEALSLRCISMVGTRRISTYGQRLCNDLVQGLAALPRLAIVSGMAFGVDIACHRAALAAGIPTIGILANALPDITPTQHTAVAREILDRGGAMISEINSQTRQKGTFYLPRNRIIAAISAGTVVVESPATGGSLITAQLADGYNRTVMAPPGRTTDMNSSGTNALIRNRKAVLVRSANDIIEELQWELDPAPQAAATENDSSEPELSPEEQRLLALFDDDPRTTDDLIQAGGYDFNTLSTLLIGLELAGFIRQLPGNRYERLKYNPTTRNRRWN